MPQTLNFTKTAIENVPIPARGKVRYTDTKIPGLVLRVTAGGVKAFALYRKVDGKPVEMTLGRFPAMTPEQARRAAQRKLAEIAEGKNPVVEKRKRKVKAITLSQVMEEYKAERELAPRTLKDIDAAVRFGFPDWKNRRLTDITPDMVLRRYQKLCERGETGASASRHMRILRAVLNFAKAKYRLPDGTPLIPYNPVQILSDTKTWKRPRRRNTWIERHELKAWWAALDEINPVHADLFRFIVLTGLRPSEAKRLRWADVNLEGRTFTIPETKNHRPHTLPLSDYLQALLVRRHTGATHPWVFADEQGRTPSNFRYAQDKVARLTGIRFTPYDLRRTFATIAESLDIPAYALKRLLNHSTGSDVTAGYIVIDVERLREPMQKITDFILKTAGVKESATITQLRRKEV